MAKSARRKKSFLGKIIFTLLLLIAIPVVALTAIIATFDVNSYRGEFERLAYEKTGRTIKMNGPISWGFSLQDGLVIQVEDIKVDNPSWASRKQMAQIGYARLHLNVMDLFRRKINIVAFELGDTDIQLENNRQGEANWDFFPQDKKEKQPEKKSETQAPISINIDAVKITKSRFALRNEKGELSIFDVPVLTLKQTPKGMTLNYQGTLAGYDLDLDMKGARLEKLNDGNWPFTLQAKTSGLTVDSNGQLVDGVKKIRLDQIKITIGKSDLSGKMTIDTSGAVPLLVGTLSSERLDVKDFSALSKNEPESKQPAASGPLFSREPMDFSALQAANARFDIDFKKLVSGGATIDQLKTKLALQGGRLTMIPITGIVAGSPFESAFTFDASSPSARTRVIMKADALDLGTFVKLGGMESFILGKTHMDLDLAATGRSTYDFASSANGRLSLVMDAGSFAQGSMIGVASNLLKIFAPGVGSLSNMALNCMAARFLVTNGLVETQGLLIDTPATTVAGAGTINLPNETINMFLRTGPKVQGIDQFLPPLAIGGSLTNPSFMLDMADTAKQVAGAVVQSSLSQKLGINDTAQQALNIALQGPAGQTQGPVVPQLVTIAGKNTCEATLDAPKALTTPAKPPPAIEPTLIPPENIIEEAGQELKGVLQNKLGQGLNKLLGGGR
ncbi:MAG: AsmA family protein [Alphaproteobacteria bacterium]|nr:AsmA family protein [Alphaproteobacteria bacterium]